ncbi:hypothetical protein SFC65_27695 [Priestia filamentosa]|uniref:hypothetical protein n=1 Tax=Priestia filamentosa TaxID=1402861 RepID=UPI003981AF7F
MDRKRIIDKVELEFDFTEMNHSRTFTLLHTLYLDTEKEGLALPSTAVPSEISIPKI